MKTMLYFSDGTAGLDATTEGLCVDANLLKSMEPISATTMNLYFDAMATHHVDSVSTLDDSAGVVKYDHVLLTITSGKFKDVSQAITQLINSAPHSDGFLVVCDALNSVFCDSRITDCAIHFLDADTAG